MAHSGLDYYCDAAVDSAGRGCAVAVVVRDASRRLVAVETRRLGRMTNNEAEYEALILALELALARGDRDDQITFLLDSQIVVGQVGGMFAVRDRKLAPRHQRVIALLARLPAATLVYIPREHNRVADAFAVEALEDSR